MPSIRSSLARLRSRIRYGPQVFPPIEPFSSFYLKVDEHHELYIEQCGNAAGTPVVFLHGGPGAGCNAFNRRFFDPRRYHIILFDQRGAGRSRPYASLKDNTTQHLIADLEQIREHLCIGEWLLFGGSWGATLALLYAQRFPEHVSGMILRGVFLCTEREIRWLYEEGASRIFPEHWEAFSAVVPQGERHAMLRAYHRMLSGDDEALATRAAIAWSTWEGRTSTLLSSPSQTAYYADPTVAVCMAKIESHYFLNAGFLDEDQIIRDAHRLTGIRGTVIHGRYDMVCPLESAWELHKAWQESDLQIVAASGHSATEAGISRALIAATSSHLKHRAHVST